MKQDRFLLAILGAVVLLVITALVVFFIRENPNTYGPDDTPAGVVKNYIVALHNEDYERAYSYLQDAKNKPDFQTFQKAFLSEQPDISGISVRIKDTKLTGDEAAVVLVLTHGGNRPFQGSWSEKGSAFLEMQDQQWKLTEMPYPYWGSYRNGDWYP